jgi:hypothetical protein
MTTEADYDRIAAQFPAVPPERLQAWVETVLRRPVLLYAYSGSAWPYPYAAEDYTEDPK